MARWPDIATWVGPTVNTSGTIADHMYVVIHTADGSYDGTIAWQKNPSAQVSSHFIVAKDGRVAQMLDTDSRSWCQIAGNPYSIAVENEGNENTPLTAAQIEANARILARAHQVHGVPLQLTGTVGVRGLGHHSMGAESGVNWGHSACPGNIIKAQKPQILARAQQFAAGAPLTTGDDVSAHTDAVIAAWESGLTTASDGTFVAPVDWEVRHEKFEASTAASLANLAAAIADVKTAVTTPPAVDVQKLAQALAAAGIGQVDVDRLATALAAHLPSHITLTGTVS